MKKLAFVLAVILSLFAYSVYVRSDYFGRLGDGHHQWLSGSTLKFASYWYKQGPVNLKFAFLEVPYSVESQTLASRDPYVSYPPGTAIPFYLLCKLLQQEPNAKLLMGWNLANQIAIALLLAGCVILLLGLDAKINIFWAIFAGAAYILLPGPMFYHQNVFFSDQAIMLFFAIILFCEALILTGKSNRAIFIFEFFVMLLASATDWFGFVIAGGVLVLRLINANTRKNFLYWLAPILANTIVLALFAWQLWLLDSFAPLIKKFYERTGINNTANDPGYFVSFWLNQIEMHLGTKGIATVLLLGSFSLFVYLGFKNRKNLSPQNLRIFIFGCFLFLTPLAQTYLLKNHSKNHDFSALKFSVVTALLPFVLLGALAKQYIKIKNIEAYIACLGIVYLSIIHIKWHKLYPENSLENIEVAQWLQKNSQFEDLVFGYNFSIENNPPQLLSISNKKVHLLYNVDDLKNFLNKMRLDSPANLLLITRANCTANSFSPIANIENKWKVFRLGSSNSTIDLSAIQSWKGPICL